jgi:hypothetical protein
MQKKRDAMIAKLYADFELHRLVAVMGFVFQGRRERAGTSSDNAFRIDPERISEILELFLAVAFDPAAKDGT